MGEADARRLREGFAHFDLPDLLNLAVGQAICRVDQAGHDFNLQTSLAPKLSQKRARKKTKKVIAASRRQHASKRERAAPAPTTAPEKAPKKSSTTKDAPTLPFKDPLTAPQSTEGRGGREHKRLQQLFKRQAQSLGYKASVEHTLPDGAGAIDLYLKKDSDTIACEISVSTGGEHELKNLRKCLAAGASVVCLIVPTKKRLAALKKKILAGLEEAERESLHFQLPEDFLAWLQERALASMDSQTRSRGYRVTLSREAISETDQAARKRNLGQILGKLFRKKDSD